MSIHTSESKTQQSVITETYQFQYYQTVYRYTSAPIDFTVGGYTFTADAVERSGYTIGSKNEITSLQVSLPATNALALLLKPIYDIRPLKVTIVRYFSDEPAEGESIFIGELTAVSFADGVCQMSFENKMNLVRRSVCRVRMQAQCNNQLYDTTCALDRQDYSVNAIVTVSTSGKQLTSATFSLFDDNYFTIGTVLFNGHHRIVTKHVGADIWINRSIDGLVTGSRIVTYAGCDKAPSTCDSNKFNNLTNFVGMPYIPLKDIAGVPITSV
jgi:uncharacterized phage protein (TIGR02218 family)